jgi:hypothetical protein
LLDNLKNRTAEEVITAIRGKPEGLKGTNGFEEIFTAPTRFNCIKSFRDLLNEADFKNPGYKETIMNSDVILLNPAKPIHNEKIFKYDML